MKLMKRGLALVLLSAATAAAQDSGLTRTNVSPLHFRAWQENCGWTDWRQAGQPPGSEGAVIHGTFLSGMIWLENAGWLTLGDGTPGIDGARPAYSNSGGEDAGVNINPKGDLDGFAWGENIGWVNFNTLGALGDARARYDAPAERFRGYAWGENVGWLNLDDARLYVARVCYADCDENRLLNVNDFTCFLNRFAARDPYANCDGSGMEPVFNVNDFRCFLNRFAAGCP